MKDAILPNHKHEWSMTREGLADCTIHCSLTPTTNRRETELMFARFTS